MDLDPELRRAVTCIRDSLRGYAKSRAWAPDSYRISMVLNTDWNTITVDLFREDYSRSIPPDLQLYNEIMDQFEKDFDPVPGLFQSTFLLIRPLDDYSMSGYRNAPGNLLEVDDGFLNPDVKRENLRGSIIAR